MAFIDGDNGENFMTIIMKLREQEIKEPKVYTDMTQEDKELLLKDLCARLPYGVIVDYKENKFETPHWKITAIYPNTFNGWIGYDKRVGAGSESGSRPFNIGEVKPYLRPMSSMTEEEKEELNNIPSTKNYLIVKDDLPWDIANWKQIVFLLKNHFDFLGLIEKGLAISTEVFNPYKD